MLDQFIGKTETYYLKRSKVEHYSGANTPDKKSILRRTLDLNYKPEDAASLLVLRAGIEKGREATIKFIRDGCKN